MTEGQKGADLVRRRCGRRFFSICCVKKKKKIKNKQKKKRKTEPFRCFILHCEAPLMPLLAELTCWESHQRGRRTHGEIFFSEEGKERIKHLSLLQLPASVPSGGGMEGGWEGGGMERGRDREMEQIIVALCATAASSPTDAECPFSVTIQLPALPPRHRLP